MDTRRQLVQMGEMVESERDPAAPHELPFRRAELRVDLGHGRHDRSFYEGRSVEKKRAIAEAITDALVRIGGSKREGVHVIFENIAKENWVIGGAPETVGQLGKDR